MKEKIKKMPGFKYLNRIRIKFLMNKESNYDKRIFLKNFIYSKNKSKSTYEYDMMLAIHQIEKGMSCKHLRPFAKDKVRKIIDMIPNIDVNSYVYNYSINILKKYSYYSINILKKYSLIYEQNEWINLEEYKIVNNFLKNVNNFKEMNVGSLDLHLDEIKNDFSIDLYKFLKSRHSVRNFSSDTLRDTDIEKAINMAILTPTACNRQMCNIYFVDSKDNKTLLENCAQGLGLFDLSNANYFIVTFDVSANHFVGERNQGWFNAGLFSMNFVNALHSLGIGSCFVQFGNSSADEEKLKKAFYISDSERIAVIIVAGYYAEVSKIPCSTRKEVHDIFKKI